MSHSLACGGRVSTCMVYAKMEWTNGKVLRFLELYQMQSCIWDPQNDCHKVKTKINDAWIEIKNNMGEPTCTVKELKKKKDSLMSMYRGYKTKIKKSQVSGASASEIYKPTWFAYELMDTFLSGIYKCNLTINTEENEQDAELTDGMNTSHDTETTLHDETSTVEVERPVTSGYSSSQQKSCSPTPRRRQYNPPELQQAKKQMDQAFNLLQNITQPHHKEEEDECSLFGRLVAKKMRKLEDDRRDLMMIKINQLFYDENQVYEGNSPNSSSTIRPYCYTPSPVPIIQTQHEDSMQQETTSTETTHTGSTTDVMAQHGEIVYLDDFDYENSSTAKRAQATNLKPLYRGPAKELSQFVIFKNKQLN